MTLTRRRMLAALTALPLAACAGPEAPPPTSAALTLTGAADMNGGRPAKVAIFWLRGAAAFEAADFFALSENPGATLGADLAAMDERLLAPGRTVEAARSFDGPPPVALGLVAGFRNVGRPGWRAVVPLAPHAANAVAATLTGDRVVVGP